MGSTSSLSVRRALRAIERSAAAREQSDLARERSREQRWEQLVRRKRAACPRATIDATTARVLRRVLFRDAS